MTAYRHPFPEPALIDARPLATGDGSWLRFAGPAISTLIVLAVAFQLRTIDLRTVIGLMPGNPLFWGLFAAYVLSGPVAEWLIFRRLWHLPLAGFAALLRKLVSNELLLGYSGELYFYTWARRHAALVAAPFGAIKDVTILSAVVGNAFCLVMVLLAWPLLGSLRLGISPHLMLASAGVVLVTSGAAMLFRRRLFTLPRDALGHILAIHIGRILATTLLAAAMWHLLLPQVVIGWWLVLGAVRQLLSRLPLLPNKDVVFVGVATVLVGGEVGISAAMALMASLLLVAYLVTGAVLATFELLGDDAR